MIKFLDKITRFMNAAFVTVAAAFLLAMSLLTCASIAGRLAGRPLKGAVELVSFFGAVTATFALAYTQLKKDHICVTILVDKFPAVIKKIAGILNDIMCMLLSLIATVQIFKIGNTIVNSGEVTETLRIPFAPFIYAAAAAFGMLTFVFFAELLKTATKGLLKEPSVFEKEFEEQDG